MFFFSFLQIAFCKKPPAADLPGFPTCEVFFFFSDKGVSQTNVHYSTHFGQNHIGRVRQLTTY